MPDTGMSRKRSRAEEARIVLEAMRNITTDYLCPACGVDGQSFGKDFAHEPDCPVLLARDLLATPEEQPFLMGQSYFVEDRAVRLVLESKKIPDNSAEDGGQALIMWVDGESGIFAKVQSWDDSMQHADLKRFLGKKVRVIIEAVEE